MKTSTTIKCGSILSVLLILFITSSGFTSGRRELPGPKDPVKLVYNPAEGKSISYLSSTAVSQAMDINGQTMNVFIENKMAYKVKMAGKSGDNLKLEITIDSLNMKVDSPQGSTGSKVKDVEGKLFNMILSPIGKEVDISEAEKIEYTVEGSGSGNLSQSFASIFPDLPEKAVKPGDTWTKTDTIQTKTAASKVTQIVQSTNKYEGMEKINGLDCAKISSTVSGTMETTAQNQGMDIFYSGPFQGTVTLYFAVKEGYFVKQEVLTKMTGTVEISGPQSMTFPVTMETNAKVEVVK
jgi:hypothetical protein